MRVRCSWHGKPVVESLQDVHLLLDQANLFRRVQLDELIDVNVASAYPHVYLVALFNFYMNLSWAKAVHTLRLPYKHYFNIVSIWEFVDELSQSLIYVIVFSRNVNAVTLFKLRLLFNQTKNLFVIPEQSLIYMVFQSLNFCFLFQNNRFLSSNFSSEPFDDLRLLHDRFT